MMKLSQIAAILALALPAMAAAQSDDDGNDKPRRIVRVGLGAQLVPDHPGADGMKLSPIVNIDLKREGDTFDFEAPDQSFSLAIVTGGGFSFGPAANFESSRRPSRFPVPIPKVSTTFEAGGFIQQRLSDSFRVRAEVRKGLGGHDGWVSQLAADFVARDEDNYVFSIGPRVSWADGRYHRAYFGVTPAVATASGLPAFNPDGGIKGVGGVASLHHQLGSRVGIFGYGGYERLVGDAGRSPIVRTYGSRDQFSAGLGLSFQFGL